MARAGRIAGAALGALLLAGTATACGGSSGDGAAPAPTGTASAATASPYPPVPSGVALASPGADLQLGQSATVAWKPAQDVVGVLDVTVTGIASTTFDQSFKGWELDEATKASAPYFVTATVRNAGSTDLGGRPVPLYGAAASGALVEPSTFAADFKPCQPGVLPTPFPAGASADVCLVFLVPAGGALDGVSFRPTQSFTPITWTGTVTPLPEPTPAAKGKTGKTGKTGKAGKAGKKRAGTSPSASPAA